MQFHTGCAVLLVFKLDFMSYNALRIISTGIIYQLSTGRDWGRLAENARFFSMKDQEDVQCELGIRL